MAMLLEDDEAEAEAVVAEPEAEAEDTEAQGEQQTEPDMVDPEAQAAAAVMTDLGTTTGRVVQLVVGVIMVSVVSWKSPLVDTDTMV